ncbi:MAG: polyprenyl diphosphate synthase, partial [Actinomycetota bacterium]|nr:polyprenyl diphosphate synthase [Actinomycetota bacterium]
MIAEVLYRLYERRLAAELRKGLLPRHIGVVLDGNRRFARAKGLDSVAEGHRLGADKIHQLLDWCHELAIPYVTLWLLSTDNLRRDAAEVSDLVSIIADTVNALAHNPGNRSRGLRITAVGALDSLPDELRRVLKEADEATADHEGLHLQVAVGYGGRQEITDALRSLLTERLDQGARLEDVIADLTPETIAG